MTRNSIFCCALLLGFVSGCGRAPYDVAPVQGKVTVDDTPLFQGKVMFAPVAKGEDIHPGKPSFGRIQSDGTYQLSTFRDNDGAIVGEHWVTIINSDEELPDGVPEFARVQIPEKVTVQPAQVNQIDLRLTRDIVRENREDDR